MFIEYYIICVKFSSLFWGVEGVENLFGGLSYNLFGKVALNRKLYICEIEIV